MSRPFKENTLFCGDMSRAKFNACVGNNGGPYDMHDYAQGFFRSAELTLKSIVKEKNPYLDLLIYPAAFNFRHGIELSIKSIMEQLAKLGTLENNSGTHTLLKDWESIKPLLKKLKLKPITDEKIQVIETIIICYCEVDPKGEVFRYPESIKKDPYLREWSLINTAVLLDNLLLTKDIFDDCHCALSEFHS